ncbi:hypothetical protein WMF04_11425 [Sorangium sp. So ce260]|uniref:hypothetical protein n=1 Tax=Sorangium sp. So ce260 TaxID=3133291 RepID=UPI003F60D064
MVPASFLAFRCNPTLGSLVLLQKVERNFAQQPDVLDAARVAKVPDPEARRKALADVAELTPGRAGGASGATTDGPLDSAHVPVGAPGADL